MELKLYELAETYEQIMDLDLPAEDIQTMLDSLNVSLEEKASNIAHVKRTMDSGIDALKNEEKRLKAKRKAIENRLDSIKDYLFTVMKATNTQKIKTDTDSIYISGRDSSKVVDRNKLPKKYLKQKITISVDKKQLNKDIKNEDIDGVEKIRNEWVVIR
ncbi:MAG: siphovirus Gp157 family protein [Candidatus Cloacimonadota bacterium]|nr:siphovirus Gp157 family protein [Candidatus Cloacimonadota bacterium]